VLAEVDRSGAVRLEQASFPTINHSIGARNQVAEFAMASLSRASTRNGQRNSQKTRSRERRKVQCERLVTRTASTDRTLIIIETEKRSSFVALTSQPQR
jgi:hypothetical protein